MKTRNLKAKGHLLQNNRNAYTTLLHSYDATVKQTWLVLKQYTVKAKQHKLSGVSSNVVYL